MPKKEIAVADRAFALHQQLIGLKESAVKHFYRLGRIMKEVRDNELWKAMNHPSFKSYFSDPELGFEDSSVYRAISVVEKFPDPERLAHVPLGKIYIILPYVTDKNRNKLLELAGGLSRGDLIHQLGPGKEPDEDHRFMPIPKIYRCDTCKKIKGVSFNLLCHCGWTPKQIETISRAIEKIDYGGE